MHMSSCIDTLLIEHIRESLISISRLSFFKDENELVLFPKPIPHSHIYFVPHNPFSDVVACIVFYELLNNWQVLYVKENVGI